MKLIDLEGLVSKMWCLAEQGPGIPQLFQSLAGGRPGLRSVERFWDSAGAERESIRVQILAPGTLTPLAGKMILEQRTKKGRPNRVPVTCSISHEARKARATAKPPSMSVAVLAS